MEKDEKIKSTTGEIKNKVFETYAKDMAKVIEDDKAGLIKRIIHEQEEHDAEKKNFSPKSDKNQFFLFSSIALLFLAFCLLMFLAFFNKKVDTLEITPQYTPPIFIDKNYFQDIGGFIKDQITQSISNEVENTTVKAGGIEGIYLIENKLIIGFSRFMVLMKANIPANFSNFINDNMLIGVFKGGISEVSSQIVVPVPVDNTPKIKTPTPAIVIEGVPMTLDSSAFFKTGTTEFVDLNAKDKAKKAISDFLDSVDFTTSKIQVTGTYSVERPSAKNNQIAEARRNLGVDILNEVLNEKYNADDIIKITIESDAKGVSIYDIYTKEEIDVMSAAELKNAIDATQGIQYTAEAKTKSKIISAPTSTSEVSSLPSLDTEVKKDTAVPFVPTSTDLFVLLKVTSFADIFPVMRDWENKMFSDMQGFFGIELSSDTSYLLTKNFENGIIQNKNARILKNKENNIVIMYVFLDNDSIVITNSEKVTAEVILRLGASRIKK